jgi:hypothetical protein
MSSHDAKDRSEDTCAHQAAHGKTRRQRDPTGGEESGIPRREPEGISFEESLKLNQAEQFEKLYRQLGHTDDALIAEQLRYMARQFNDRAIELTPAPDPRDLPGFDMLAALVGVSFEVNDALDASLDALRPEGPQEANAETVRALVHLRRAKQRITRTTNELGKMAREQVGVS